MKKIPFPEVLVRAIASELADCSGALNSLRGVRGSIGRDSTEKRDNFDDQCNFCRLGAGFLPCRNLLTQQYILYRTSCAACCEDRGERTMVGIDFEDG
jgi:hypothetical protein